MQNIITAIFQNESEGYQMITELSRRSDKTFELKEGTLYPILYRMEDEGLIRSKWSQGEGRVAPKKMYEATETGILENIRRMSVW